MSFNYYARKVRNLRLDSRTRRSALASCILRLCWLTQQPYQATRARFTAQLNWMSLTRRVRSRFLTPWR